VWAVCPEHRPDLTGCLFVLVLTARAAAGGRRQGQASVRMGAHLLRMCAICS
jgi:hypothetical protein